MNSNRVQRSRYTQITTICMQINKLYTSIFFGLKKTFFFSFLKCIEDLNFIIIIS